MGRDWTGARTSNDSKEIDLTFLLKHKYIVKNAIVTGILSWGDGNCRVGIETSYRTGKDSYIRLYYTIVTENKKETQYDYKIDLIEVNSNLGKGKVLYMCCPQSGRSCRKLYLAYNSHIWKARQAYKSRLYYPIQVVSKNDRANSRYWQLDRQIKKAYQERSTYQYNGQMTKRALRIDHLKDLQLKYDHLRFGQLALALEKMKVEL